QGSALFSGSIWGNGTLYWIRILFRQLYESYLDSYTSATKTRIGLWLMLADTIRMLLLGLFTTMTVCFVIVSVFIFVFIGSFVYPNYSIRILSLFPQMAGAVSAIVASIIAALLKSNTQAPLAATYMLICLNMSVSVLFGQTK